MNTFTRTALVALAATGFTLASAATAGADTNKSEQISKTTASNLATILSPAASPGGHAQVNGQNMTKTNTSNISLIDYFGTALFMPIV